MSKKIKSLKRVLALIMAIALFVGIIPFSKNIVRAEDPAPTTYSISLTNSEIDVSVYDATDLEHPVADSGALLAGNYKVKMALKSSDRFLKKLEQTEGVAAATDVTSSVTYSDSAYWYSVTISAGNILLTATLDQVAVTDKVEYWNDSVVKSGTDSAYVKESGYDRYFKDKLTFNARQGKFVSFEGDEFKASVDVTETKQYTCYWESDNANRTSGVKKYKFQYKSSFIPEIWSDATLYLTKDNIPVLLNCSQISPSSDTIYFSYFGANDSRNKNVNIELTATDAGAGVDKVVYSQNSCSKPFENDANVNKLSLNRESKGYINTKDLKFIVDKTNENYDPNSKLFFYTKDKVNNRGTKEVKLCNDIDEPTITSVSPSVEKDSDGSVEAKQIGFTIVANDPLSGIDKIVVKCYKIVGDKTKLEETKIVSGSDLTNAGSGNYTGTVEFSKPSKSGAYKYSAVAYDKVDNFTQTEFYFDGDFIWDNEAPVITTNLELNVADVKISGDNKENITYDLFYNKSRRKTDAEGAPVALNLAVGLNVDKKVEDPEHPEYSLPIKSVQVKVDDILAYSDSFEKSERVMKIDTIPVNTNIAGAKSNYQYTITANVVDFGGNEATYTWNVKPDTDNPMVTAVKFIQYEYDADNNRKPDSGVEVDARDDSTDTLAFFEKDSISFKIYSEDVGAGVSYANVEFFPADKDANDETSNVVIRKEINKNEKEISFEATEFKSGFNGYAVVQLYDRVGNPAAAFTTKYFAVENNDQHWRSANISVTPIVDENNKPKGDIYVKKPKFKVVIKDYVSGIKDIKWRVLDKSKPENENILEIIDNMDFLNNNDVEKKYKHGVCVEATFTARINVEGNDLIPQVLMKDNCRNESFDAGDDVTVDTEKPTIDIKYSNEKPDATYKTIYKTSRTVKVYVKDRNIDPKTDVKFKFEKGSMPKIKWEKEKEKADNDADTDAIIHVGTMVFDSDDEYYFTVSAKDKAGWEADPKTSESFIIDKTAPSISVSVNGGKPSSGDYYNTKRVAVVTVRDKNFDPSRIEVHGKSVIGDQKGEVPPVSDWKDNGDVHTGTIAFESDGYYEFYVDGMDMAGNQGNKTGTYSFNLDLQKPMVEIDGVKNMSANAGEVMPTVTMMDENIVADTASVVITRANGEKLNLENKVTKDKGFITYQFANFKKDRDYDDLYTMKATVTDKAGNVGTKSVIFSINRFGSVYTFDSELEQLDNTYMQKPVDIVLSETNVDKLKEDSIKIVVSKNGEPTTLESGKDYAIESANVNGGWNRYNYTISSDNFKEEGIYTVSVYSKDAAGNTNENIEDEKTEISFGIDATAPVINTVNIESNETYNSQKYNTVIDVTDNLTAVKVDVSVDGKSVEVKEDNGRYSFNIPESTDKQSVVINAVDEAGNISTSTVNNVLVSTNAFVRWHNNTKLFVGSVIAMILALLALIAFIILKQKNVVRVRRK